MKTESATTNTTSNFATDATMTADASASAAEALPPAASAHAAGARPADAVETLSDDTDQLAGKDSRWHSLGDIHRPSQQTPIIAQPRDLTGLHDGTTTQVAGPTAVGSGTPITVDASTVGSAVDVVTNAKLVAETADLVHVVATQRGLLNATYNLFGASGATEVLEFNSKLPSGRVMTYGGGALALTSAARNGYAIGEDLRDGKLSSDSVMPALDIASDIVGQTKHPLAVAWSTGWSIGRAADDYTGASDKASDLAAYGTTTPWAGTVKEGRQRIQRQKEAARMRREAAVAARREREAEKKARAPRAAAEAPRLDAANTRVDDRGRVFVDDEYVGRYERGRFIAEQTR